jgi:hypothetical protein
MRMGLIAHFAINADDVSATRRFYEKVLGWTFTAWGPPGFYHISADDTEPRAGAGADADAAPIIGALQKRRELLPGRPTNGFECTVAVADVDDVARAVTANGGRMLMERSTIAGVGDLIYFADPSGNVLGAMRYDPTAE